MKTEHVEPLVVAEMTAADEQHSRRKKKKKKKQLKKISQLHTEYEEDKKENKGIEALQNENL